ncbi:hypothetical protein ACQCN2_02920 [Brevibacillus ginsengisoli]|uniref:hypothetical protein n=1 Tax=Brevibacillus ginsengisoli TaxID=363854 RepID=UPI003CF78350
MKKHIWKRSVAALLTFSLVGGFSIFTAPASTHAESAEGVAIAEFQYLDKEFDRISTAVANQADGAREGHLKLNLALSQETEIKSIILRTADESGKANYHGTWKTNKQGVGYLLAVYQNGKVLNPTYQDTLGKFKGNAQFELYGNDNNSIKAGEFFYVDIETDKGSITSELSPYRDQPNPTPVSIKDFSLIDKASDKIGIADFKPEGKKDGHFKLNLNITQPTLFNAVVLRSTDSYGKENHQGIWRTNHAGTGWLLGITQTIQQPTGPVTKVITPAFRANPKDPVGTFNGAVSFDFYASDNGTIKEGQYYVAEIETPTATIFSKPITFGEPMTGETVPTTPSTPSTPTTPSTPPTPGTPSTPSTPAPSGDLNVIGSTGKVLVSKAKPNALVTLMQKEGTMETNYGTMVADPQGTFVFTDVPTGSGYYCLETVNGVNTRKSTEVTVIEEKTFTILDPKISFTSFLYPYASKDREFNVSIGNVHSSQPVKTAKLTIGPKSYPIGVLNTNQYEPHPSSINNVSKTASITLETTAGDKQKIIRKIDYDLVDDTSLVATRVGDYWMIKGKLAPTYVKQHLSGFNMFVLDSGIVSKLAPTVDSNTMEFQVDLQSKSAKKDIILIVVDGYAPYEVLHIMP